MKCQRCGNENLKWFGQDEGTWYCRKCVAFGRLDAGIRPAVPTLIQRRIKDEPQLEFDLTPAQQQASQQALDALQRGKNVFVYAAAGAGKTEMSMASIAWYLHQGKKVCFAISRRQVVLEIARRMQQAFPALRVVAVCEGYTRETDGDLIVCTTHQLYRYPQCFDLLILDEMDAFPFAGSALLENMARQACRGQKLLLSATPDEQSMKEVEEGKMEIVQLFKRPHGYQLCVPQVVCGLPLYQLWQIWKMCRRFHQRRQQVLVFVPRKRDTQWMAFFLSRFWKTGQIHSSSLEKDRIMEQFYHKETEILITTTLLERGITVPSVQVLVYRADHVVFTKASLIQIFGRVGRSFKDPQGEGVCFCEKISPALQACIEQLEWMNRTAFGA